MPDVFNDTVAELVDQCPGVLGAAFTDYDGEEIAIYPAERKEELRLYAVYGGIALRRIAAAEEKAGGGVVRSVVASGDHRALISLQVSDAYQLVLAVEASTPPAQAITAARSAAKIIESEI